MRLETINGPRVIDTIDRALIGLIGATRTPGIYEVGPWRIKVTSSHGHSTAVFRNEVDDIWVCECTNES